MEVLRGHAERHMLMKYVDDSTLDLDYIQLQETHNNLSLGRRTPRHQQPQQITCVDNKVASLLGVIIDERMSWGDHGNSFFSIT